MHILFHEQAVYGRDTNWKKVYLMSEGNIAMWLNYFMAASNTMFLQLIEQKEKEVENVPTFIMTLDT